MPPALRYPCPECGEITFVRSSYTLNSGLQQRRRECPECGNFVTLERVGVEELQYFVSDRPSPEPEPELEPLELSDTPQQRIMDLWLSVRVRAIWSKAAQPANGRRMPGQEPGYALDREGSFYVE